jgi:hypothetical protein
MTTKRDALSNELAELVYDSQSYGAPHERRIAAIKSELAKLARKRLSDRIRRQILWDINGHHGRA